MASSTATIPALSDAARHELASIVGPRHALTRAEDLALYEYDGGVDKARPEMVVFPTQTEQVAALVRTAIRHELPITGRGAGTGLSGGAIPRRGGLAISFARMNKILEIDLPNERMRVQPGVVNLDISLAVARDKYFYAPDPSSQRACTIGGNVAENAGGPHTLAYGVTTNHVISLEMVLADGSIVRTGGKSTDAAGYDLTGLFTGSEGTMALVTEVTVRLMRAPEAVKTILVIFDSAIDCGRAVSGITAKAITPVAVEMLDGVMLRMVEEATHAGFPMDAEAVLLIELEGLREQVDEQAEQIREVCAVGRVSPFYYVQDGVVPRTKIPAALDFVRQTSEKYGLTISNIFHAGDGNLHPIILFDMRKPGDLEKAQHAGEDILDFCISAGGSITGEHGVGMEKMELMAHQFPPDSLELIASIKRLFDPTCNLNPGKVLPTGRGCMEIRQRPLTPSNTL